MKSKIDTAHLRRVALSRFDTQLLWLLMQSGGEYPMPETAEAQALIETTRGKGLIKIVERYGARSSVRLTDEGRAVCSQLEAMNVQPKLEVASK